MKKKIIFGTIICILVILIISGGVIYYNYKTNIVEEKEIEKKIKEEENTYKYHEEENVLKSIDEINLEDIDGKGTNYKFTYKDEIYFATYTKDNWNIVDSYKISNKKDIEIICKALIDIHPIHGKDMVSFRTTQDLAYEWIEHNIAYKILPEGNIWKNSAKDVDLNPEDQNKSLKEIYEDRTGKEFNINDIINK